MRSITDEHRNERLSMRVTQDDKKKLEKLSDQANESYSDTVRRLINDAAKLDYAVQDSGNRVNHIIGVIADSIDDEVYHALAHQMHGTKEEFNGVDDGEAHVKGDRKYFTVKSALYRGIFWDVLSQLDYRDEEELEKEM